MILWRMRLNFLSWKTAHARNSYQVTPHSTPPYLTPPHLTPPHPTWSCPTQHVSDVLREVLSCVAWWQHVVQCAVLFITTISNWFCYICITLNTILMLCTMSSARSNHTHTALPPFSLPFNPSLPTVTHTGKIILYTRKSGFNGVSYVIKNTHTRVLHFTMDCSTGVNIVSHRGDLKHTQIIQPGHAELLHHIMPDSALKGWQSGYSAALEWI